MREIAVIFRKELRDAYRGRWLIAFAGTFALVALLLSLVQGSGGDIASKALAVLRQDSSISACCSSHFLRSSSAPVP